MPNTLVIEFKINVLASHCGNHIRCKILAAIKNTVFFTLLADECADISCTEQVALCIRYAMKETSKGVYNAHEDFLVSIPTRDTCGAT